MLISQLLEYYSYVVLASMVLTWLPVNDTTRSLRSLVAVLTEPLLQPLRKVLPQGGQTWAPTVLYLGVVFLMRLI